MSHQYIIYEKRDRIAYLTIDRPEVMNALNPPALEELSRVWQDYMADTGLWVAILTGAGERAFSAGADLKWRAAQGEQTRDASGDDTAWILARQCLKPIIAAVNGYALGGGMAMAIECDIIIAAEHAQFGMPEPRIGYWMDDRIIKRVPYHLAMGITLTGKRFSAQEAYRMGIVNEVVPLNDLMPTAERWAREILACSPLALQATKEIARNPGQPIESLEMVRATRASADFLEGPRAFAEKRQPQWQGPVAQTLE